MCVNKSKKCLTDLYTHTHHSVRFTQANTSPLWDSPLLTEQNAFSIRFCLTGEWNVPPGWKEGAALLLGTAETVYIQNQHVWRRLHFLFLPQLLPSITTRVTGPRPRFIVLFLFVFHLPFVPSSPWNPLEITKSVSKRLERLPSHRFDLTNYPPRDCGHPATYWNYHKWLNSIN